MYPKKYKTFSSFCPTLTSVVFVAYVYCGGTLFIGVCCATGAKSGKPSPPKRNEQNHAS